MRSKRQLPLDTELYLRDSGAAGPRRPSEWPGNVVIGLVMDKAQAIKKPLAQSCTHRYAPNAVNVHIANALRQTSYMA
jgi:hypothetical protein